jgi:hypothetical protein
MATATIINGFNVDTDVSFVLQDQFGDLISAGMFGHLIEFESQSNDKTLEVTPITTGGIPIYQTVWNGINGDMRFARVNGAFQQTFSDLMSSYYLAGIIPQMTLQVRVRNRDGSVDTYMFVGFQFSKPRFGSFNATREVDMRVSWMSSTMISKSGVGGVLVGLLNVA